MKTIRNCILGICIILILVSVFLFLLKRKYILLNPLLVGKDAVIGVDLSNHQGDVDMQSLKQQNIQFAYFKATEGSSYVDEYYANNMKNANEVGLPAGAYHFFSFESSGKTQAENFIATIGDIKGQLLPMVCIEYYGDYIENHPNKNDLVTELQIFLDTMEEMYGKKIVIYIEPRMLEAYLETNFDAYPKWLRSVYYPLTWEYHGDWVIWQYADRGQLEGYTGSEQYIDLDVLNKAYTLEDLMVN